MKLVAASVLLLCLTLLAQDAASPDQVAKAAEGIHQLTEGLREPDSFSLDHAWVAHSEKHGDAICYTYRARNGFGGMDVSGASYIQNKKGQYVLNAASASWNGPTGNINDPWPGGLTWFTHCSDRAMRKETATDITKELKKALIPNVSP